MKENLLKGAKILLPLLLGGGVFLSIYQNYNFNEIFSLIHNEIHLQWLILSIICGILSNIIRAVRWRRLLTPLSNKKPSLLNTTNAVFSLYFMNALLPRLGEFYRCHIINKYERISFSRVLGTVVTERFSDVLSLFLIMCFGVLMQFNIYKQFLFEKFQLDKFTTLFSSSKFWILLVIGHLIMFLILFFIRRSNFIRDKIDDFIANIKKGILSFQQTKHKYLFLSESFLIWFCYFIQFYACILAFDSTSHLTLLQGLTLFIMGSLGVLIPIPQGIGTWHFMIIGTLQLFAINATAAAAVAFFIHSFQTLLLILLGFIALIILPITNKKV